MSSRTWTLVQRFSREWAYAARDKNGVIDLFFGVEAFALMTNRIVAGLMRDGRLSLRKAMTKRGFLLLFHGRGSTTDSTRRMDIKKHERLDAFWDLRVKLLAKPCACSDVALWTC